MQEKRVFNGLNTDDADEILPNGDYRFAQNIRLGTTEGSNDSFIQNIKSMKPLVLPTNPLGGVETTIGSIPDITNNTIYFFQYNSLNNHRILKIDLFTEVVTVVITNTSANILGFKKENLIRGDVLDGNLCWVDGVNINNTFLSNEPRQIMILDSLSNTITYTNVDILEYVSLVKIPPHLPCTFQLSTVAGDNLMENKTFQFCARFIYKNGMKSRTNFVTELAITSFGNPKPNLITVFCLLVSNSTNHDLYGKVIESIEFLVRDNYKFNFKSIGKIPYPKNGETNTNNILFNNSSVYTSIPLAETEIGYDNVPIMAQDLVITDSRVLMANYIDGYNIADKNLLLSGSNGIAQSTPFVINSKYLKPNSKYKLCVNLYDYAQRRQLTYSINDLAFKTLPQIGLNIIVSKKTISINENVLPSWVKYYSIGISENLNVIYFFQARVENIYYVRGIDTIGNPNFTKAIGGTYPPVGSNYTITDEGRNDFRLSKILQGDYNYKNNQNTNFDALQRQYIYIDITNFTQFNNNIPYVWSKGDRIKFLSTGGSNEKEITEEAEKYDYLIEEQRGNFLVVSDPINEETIDLDSFVYGTTEIIVTITNTNKVYLGNKKVLDMSDTPLVAISLIKSEDAMSTDNYVCVVGNNGVVYVANINTLNSNVFDNNNWVLVNIGTTNNLKCVCGAQFGSVYNFYIGGENGILKRLAGNSNFTSPIVENISDSYSNGVDTFTIGTKNVDKINFSCNNGNLNSRGRTNNLLCGNLYSYDFLQLSTGVNMLWLNWLCCSGYDDELTWVAVNKISNTDGNANYTTTGAGLINKIFKNGLGLVVSDINIMGMLETVSLSDSGNPFSLVLANRIIVCVVGKDRSSTAGKIFMWQFGYSGPVSRYYDNDTIGWFDLALEMNNNNAVYTQVTSVKSYTMLSPDGVWSSKDKAMYANYKYHHTYIFSTIDGLIFSRGVGFETNTVIYVTRISVEFQGRSLLRRPISGADSHFPTSDTALDDCQNLLWILTNQNDGFITDNQPDTLSVVPIAATTDNYPIIKMTIGSYFSIFPSDPAFPTTNIITIGKFLGVSKGIQPLTNGKDVYTELKLKDITYALNLYVLNYAALVEIYTPRTPSNTDNVFYESILDTNTVNSKYITKTSGIKTYEIGKQNEGDVFVINKPFKGKYWGKSTNIVSMTPDKLNITGFFNDGTTNNDNFGWYKGNHRPNLESVDNQQQSHKKNSIIFSNQKIQGSRINGLNTFNLLDYKNFPTEYGAIYKIQETTDVQQQGSVMLVLCEWQSFSIYIGKVQFKDAVGGNIVSVSESVLGSFRLLQGNLGCITPESVKTYKGVTFWLDMNKGVVVQYGNDGLNPISSRKMKKYFYDKGIKLLPIEKNSTIYNPNIGFIDPYHDEFILCLDSITVDKTTIAYNYLKNRWQTTYTYYPESATQLNNKLISFKNGIPYLHNYGVDYNTFYGDSNNESIVEIIFNQNPSEIKQYLNHATEGDLFIAETIETKNKNTFTQLSTLRETDYEDVEGANYAALMCDRLTPNFANQDEAQINGDYLMGNVIKIIHIFANKNILQTAKSVSIGFVKSFNNIISA